METKITIIDYDEAKLYDLSACEKKTGDYKNCYLQRGAWERFQNSDLQIVEDSEFNGISSLRVFNNVVTLYIYRKYIRFLNFDAISEGDYVRIKKYNDVTSHLKIEKTSWTLFYSRPLFVKSISPSGNYDLEYNYEGHKISFYFNRESIRYLCTSEEINIFMERFNGAEMMSKKITDDKELDKISAISDAVEDGEKSYSDTDSVLSKNPSDKNTKLTLFFDYILRYNNVENIDNFLKRFEKFEKIRKI